MVGFITGLVYELYVNRERVFDWVLVLTRRARSREVPTKRQKWSGSPVLSSHRTGCGAFPFVASLGQAHLHWLTPRVPRLLVIREAEPCGAAAGRRQLAIGNPQVGPRMQPMVREPFRFGGSSGTQDPRPRN
ncbi:hypothetical protein GW17_00049243 [Ensete ventricosum]|nr:hypothetical protein GW17_00049243 [Ensete ventricosum]